MRGLFTMYFVHSYMYSQTSKLSIQNRPEKQNTYPLHPLQAPQLVNNLQIKRYSGENDILMILLWKYFAEYQNTIIFKARIDRALYKHRQWLCSVGYETLMSKENYTRENTLKNALRGKRVSEFSEPPRQPCSSMSQEYMDRGEHHSMAQM